LPAGGLLREPHMPCTTAFLPGRFARRSGQNPLSRWATAPIVPRASSGDDDDDGDDDSPLDDPLEDEESDFDDFDDDFDDDFEEEPDDPDWDHPDEETPEMPPGKKK
jgi:hypothetical protein